MTPRDGRSRTPEYQSWVHMWRRCTEPSDIGYPGYGGRGISVCQRWESFDSFLADMGPRPSDDATVERRNNALGYEPSNCIWATPAEQARNKRRYRNNRSGVTGVYRVPGCRPWRAQISVGGSIIYLGRFERFEDAVEARRAKERELGYGAAHGVAA